MASRYCRSLRHSYWLRREFSPRLSARFVCPEALPNDAARQHALQEFYDSYEQAEPAATVSEAHLYRLVLLKTHNCKQAPTRVRVLTGDDAKWSF